MRGSRTRTKNATLAEIHPPDPKSSSPTKSPAPPRLLRCMLMDIDPLKLTSTISGHPAGRGTALILQALRQQVTVATSNEYTQKALGWICDNDVLMLKLRKHSLMCRILQSDAVDSREQLARLLNAIASFTKGRAYLMIHLRTVLPNVVAVLRGRRLPSTIYEQLIATLQKLSIRALGQRELLQCGMLEWLVNMMEGRTSTYSVEYATAMAINLASNSAAPPLQLRFADSLSAAAISVLNKENHGPSCSLYNSLVYTWLGCSRVRFRAKETKLLDAIRTRLNKKSCPLCCLHIPYLVAIIQGEVEIMKVPQSPTENDSDLGGDSCEREIDATDPLRPTSNELSGARLLLRRAHIEHPNDESTSVPGQVAKHSNAETARSNNRNRGEPRLGTATSCHTFVIETERRRPILVPTGLTDGAIEYKKSQDAAAKARELEEKKREKERAEKEAADKERLKAAARSAATSRPKASLGRKTTWATKGVSVERLVIKDNSSRESIVSPVVDKTIGNDENFIEAGMSAEDYTAAFAARPKVARTPEHKNQSRSFF